MENKLFKSTKKVNKEVDNGICDQNLRCTLAESEAQNVETISRKTGKA